MSREPAAAPAGADVHMTLTMNMNLTLSGARSKMTTNAIRLFHITSDPEWQVAQAFGEYRPRRFAEEGFIHCSYAQQVKGVADRIFKGTSDLVLLEIDPSRLSCRIVDENLEGGAQLFPHIYGALPLDAVSTVHAFPCEADGTFACRMI